MKIYFNPVVPCAFNSTKTVSKNDEVSNYSQKNITSLPSFGSRKPLTEQQICRQILCDQRNKNGSWRFPLTEEITIMTQALKSFKTDLKKSDLVKSLLENDIECPGKNVASDLSAKTIAGYFKVMSGAPKFVQKAFAKKLSVSGEKDAAKYLALFTDGVISKDDLVYFDKNLKGNYRDKSSRFDLLINVATNCPEIMKNEKTRNLLVEKANIENGLTYDVINDTSKMIGHLSKKGFVNFLSLMNEDSMEKVKSFVDRARSYTAKSVAEICSCLNKDNFEYVYSSIGFLYPRDIVEDLQKIKEDKIKLPKKDPDEKDEAYFERINKQLNPEQYGNEDDVVY